jgi:TonB family protein
MFSNLIESSSHAKEFKRRGSFLLFTTATYVVLFVITGVVSIYAYDTHLEQQNLEIVTLLSPQEIVPEPVTRPIADPPRNISNARNNNEAFDVRRTPTADVNQPTLAPPDISTRPNPDLPVRQGVQFRIGETDSNTTIPGANRGVPVGNGSNVPIVIPDDPPPAPAPVVPKIVKVSQQVLTSKALSLPKPPYPQMAKLSHIQGTVTVQVLIDETGKVISAKALSGHVLLIPDAQRAALQARFSPTTIGGVSVKVSGMIAYNFVLP